MVALLCRMNTSVPKFERPWFSMRAGEDGIGWPTGWLHFVLSIRLTAGRHRAHGVGAFMKDINPRYETINYNIHMHLGEGMVHLSEGTGIAAELFATTSTTTT